MKEYEVDPKELPEWCRAYFSGRPHCFIKLVTNAEIPSNWHDANVREIVLRSADNRVQKYTDTGYESAINDPKGWFFGMHGGPLPPGAQILVIDHYPRRVTLYTRDAWIKHPTQIAPTISERQKMILLIYKCLIPRARPEYLRMMRAPQWEIEELKTLGYLDGRNALTLVGRQVAEAFRVEGGGFKQEYAARDYRDIRPTSSLPAVRGENAEQ